MRSVPVWDLATRLFHWALAVLILLGLTTGEDGPGLIFTVHVSAGYAILFLLGFRLIWGFVGSRRSRFADFIYSWTTVKAYSRSILSTFEAPRYPGHNPLGGWMVVLLLSIIALTAATGLFAGDEGAGASSGRVIGAWLEPVGELHEAFANLLIPLIGLHVAGVLVDWLLTGDNLVRAMIDGRKELDEAAAAAEPRLAGPRRAAVVAAGVVAFGGYLIYLA